MGALVESFKKFLHVGPAYQYEKPAHASVLSKLLPAARPTSESWGDQFGDLLEARRKIFQFQDNDKHPVSQHTFNFFIPAVQALHSSVRSLIGRLREDGHSFSWAFRPATNLTRILELQSRETEETPLSIDDKSELTIICAQAAEEYHTQALSFLLECPERLKTMAAAALTHSACEKFGAQEKWNGECERLISLALMLDPASFESGDARQQPVKENAQRVFATLDCLQVKLDRSQVKEARENFLNLLSAKSTTDHA